MNAFLEIACVTKDCRRHKIEDNNYLLEIRDVYIKVGVNLGKVLNFRLGTAFAFEMKRVLINTRKAWQKAFHEYTCLPWKQQKHHMECYKNLTDFSSSINFFCSLFSFFFFFSLSLHPILFWLEFYLLWFKFWFSLYFRILFPQNCRQSKRKS